jgi:hypothetical protein
MTVIQDMSGNTMITCSNPEWNLFTILNADEVWVTPDPRETVTGNERAVIVRFRNQSEPNLIGFNARIDVLGIKTVLSRAQEAALLSEDYQTLDQRELRSLGEIIACQQLIPVPLSELTF